MKAVSAAARRLVRHHLPCVETYRGSQGETWIAGFEPRGPSVATYFSGHDSKLRHRSRIWRRQALDQACQRAASGQMAIVRLDTATWHSQANTARSIDVPTLVHQFALLPKDAQALQEQLLTSTTREDFRRIRRAGFSYRITRDPAVLQEFYVRHYLPLVQNRFPDDGNAGSVEHLLTGLQDGGELVCADHRGEWVAGLFNNCHADNYSLNYLGIRDGDDSIRQLRVVSALFIRSLERAVELGKTRVKYGRSLPFLGKGPVWFKAKWGGIIALDPVIRDTMRVFLDLRHAAVRRMLTESPVLHCEGNTIVATKWLDSGSNELNATCRDADRFPGVDRWYILADAPTLTAGQQQLANHDNIQAITVPQTSDRPLWLGEVLKSASKY